ncbi:hydrogenase 4 subunit B [Acidithiobacillus thiooxidans]|uniref:Hydrogenase 4 subunit B n=2 Tax=Acidithiobacillus thiooxidans TaxID=930 RepID=A0A1C2HXE9_ACITH|nr:hydrogenase 4 subunit B [Acidithiobacillus thiooxidans]OCX68422.1 hydrogenase 4 subunit B [Acidithiobacillus thiooxidans]OCX76991.1 hydrogenase 4 subunit B [Acidithiobacillus thiooxidans]OCX89743.1 hydrogenase 4 subunit B [Acidithiobacillus thiooxidans]OFC42996.1 hydrogenase 4 subunit B [Acidithiobacillus thiooxidans]
MNSDDCLLWVLYASLLALLPTVLVAIPALPIRWKRSLGFLLTVAFCLLLIVVGIHALASPALHASIPGPLTDLAWQFTLDPLSGFFLLVLGSVGFAASLHAIGYFHHGSQSKLKQVLLPYPVFVTAMVWVLLAANAYTFLVAWELMALSSTFLILVEGQDQRRQQAAYLYLLIAHIGALALFIAFALLSHGDLISNGNFQRMAQLSDSPIVANAVFGLTLLGFGAKLGLLPLHAWLPEAHPAAPSPVSALMSGAMLPIAVYGLLRIDWQILPAGAVWWGPLWLGLGLCSALFAVLYSALQTDMKRLLAYSSMENMGLILIALGLSRIFAEQNLWPLAALALIAGLFQVLNHAFFKSLLFLGSGSVLHATGTLEMSHLGGLIRSMPQTAFLVLIGIFALAGLPPLNGFASEWLLLQAFLLAPSLPSGMLRAILPLAAAGVVLVTAVAAFAIVKFYGIAFLGRARSAVAKQEAGIWERASMAFLALFCVLLGVFPGRVVDSLSHITALLLHGSQIAHQSALALTPISAQRASYLPGVFLLGIALSIAVVFVLVWWRFGRSLRRAPVWSCGFAADYSAQTQDSPTGFSQPLLRIFGVSLSTLINRQGGRNTLPVQIPDPFWKGFYLPWGRVTLWIAGGISRLQHGRITSYLLYSFLTLIVLLVFFR